MATLPVASSSRPITRELSQSEILSIVEHINKDRARADETELVEFSPAMQARIAGLTVSSSPKRPLDGERIEFLVQTALLAARRFYSGLSESQDKMLAGGLNACAEYEFTFIVNVNSTDSVATISNFSLDVFHRSSLLEPATPSTELPPDLSI